MLIEGGYLHSLKKLIEKADESPIDASPAAGRPTPSAEVPPPKPHGLGASLRVLREKLFGRSANRN
jgi:hypothetical protein